jgi:hypothetical protein
MNKVMIVSLLFNRQPLSKVCIESLFNYTTEPFDLFLWDNGSGKPTQELLDKLEGLKFVNGSTINIIRSKENIGVTEALRTLQGHRKPGQHWMKMDNDVIVPKDPAWLTDMREILENNVDNIKIIGFPPHEPKFFFNNFGEYVGGFKEHVLKLRTPLTSKGIRKVMSYRSEIILAWCFLADQCVFSGFVYPTGVKKYGAGCEASVGIYMKEHNISAAYIYPPSMPMSAEKLDLINEMCVEFIDYHKWKERKLLEQDIKGEEFYPTKLGNDDSELKIRKELIG